MSNAGATFSRRISGIWATGNGFAEPVCVNGRFLILKILVGWCGTKFGRKRTFLGRCFDEKPNLDVLIRRKKCGKEFGQEDGEIFLYLLLKLLFF